MILRILVIDFKVELNLVIYKMVLWRNLIDFLYFNNFINKIES